MEVIKQILSTWKLKILLLDDPQRMGKKKSDIFVFYRNLRIGEYFIAKPWNEAISCVREKFKAACFQYYKMEYTIKSQESY